MTTTYGNVRQNSRASLPIASALAQFRLMFASFGPEYTPDALTPSMDISAGLMGYTGDTPKAPSWTQLASFALVAGTISLSSLINIPLSPGDQLDVMTYARSQDGKNITGTRYFPGTREGVESGNNTLAGKTDGQTLPRENSDWNGFAPAGVIGRVRNVSFIGFGHSVMSGVGTNKNRPFIHHAGYLAGYGSTVFGLAGSGAQVMTANSPWNICQYHDVGFILWSINTIIQWAGTYPTADPQLFVDGHKDGIRTQARRIRRNGCKVGICTEWFAGQEGAVSAQLIAVRKKWNEYLLSPEGKAYLEVDFTFNTTELAETAVGSHIATSAFWHADLHPNDAQHQAVGELLKSKFVVGGSLNYITQAILTSNLGYEQVAEPIIFEGGQTAPGATFGKMSPWVYTGTSLLRRSAYGKLESTGLGTNAMQCCINTVDLVEPKSICKVTFSEWETVANGQGVTFGLTPTNSTAQTNGVTYGSAGNRIGLQWHITSGSLTIYRTGPTGVGVQIGNYQFYTSYPLMAAGDSFELEVKRDVVAGQNVFTTTLTRNNIAIVNAQVATETGTLWTGNLYAFLGTAGNTGTQHPAKPTHEALSIYRYNPVTIGEVLVEGFSEIRRGNRKTFTVTVKDTEGALVAGQTVTATTNVGTVGASAITAAGIATFTDTGGLNIPSGTALETEVTVTVSCGGVTNTFTAIVKDEETVGVTETIEESDKYTMVLSLRQGSTVTPTDVFPLVQTANQKRDIYVEVGDAWLANTLEDANSKTNLIKLQVGSNKVTFVNGNAWIVPGVGCRLFVTIPY